MSRIWSSMPDIYIDADGCPVIEETLQAAEAFGFPVILVCDTSHAFAPENASVLMADKGKDALYRIRTRRLGRYVYFDEDISS